MLVIENGRTLHVLHPMQFLDSPEWFGVSSDDFFQVISLHFFFLTKRKRMYYLISGVLYR